jgi:hypothetical protein
MRWPASRRPCGSQTFAKTMLAPGLTASRLRSACNACCRSMQTNFPACFVGIQSLTMPSLPQTDKDALESLIDPGPRSAFGSSNRALKRTASSCKLPLMALHHHYQSFVLSRNPHLDLPARFPARHRLEPALASRPLQSPSSCFDCCSCCCSAPALSPTP